MVAQHSEQSRPYQEPMPKMLARDVPDTRFDEYLPDYFWPVAKGGFAFLVGLMGLFAVRDMYVDKYNWVLALSWTSNAVMFLAGIAFIDKHRAK